MTYVIVLRRYTLEKGHGRFVNSEAELYLTVYENRDFLRREAFERRNGVRTREQLFCREFSETCPQTYTRELIQEYRGLFSSPRPGVQIEAVFRLDVLDTLVERVFRNSQHPLM